MSAKLVQYIFKPFIFLVNLEIDETLNDMKLLYVCIAYNEPFGQLLPS